MSEDLNTQSLLRQQGLEPVILQSPTGLRVEVLPYGATIRSIQLDGQELTLQHPQISDYLENNGYLGSTVGRYANRIAGGLLRFGAQIHQLETAGGEHCLHGGKGFSHRLWQVQQQSADQLLLFLHSHDGDCGFPGDLLVWQQIRLEGTTVHIHFRATTNSSTVISLTNHCYFNLDGSADIGGHQLQIHADAFLPVDASLIPTGQRQLVADTAFDFRQPISIASQLAVADPQLQQTGGFDHCYLFPQQLNGSATDEPIQPLPALQQMATLSSPLSNISLTVSSTLPGLQFYAGHGLTAPFSPRQGLCLEAQHWPDAPNRPDFPSALLVAGQIWQQQIVYAFGRDRSFE
ncbi:galactose mutarotase [Rheinheimera riviphila]|uniref:Aldose 1-epimerase n=2 Tax=Rheinheimera riviphila TaxID=1834037 RepID=A0A437R5P5_9GAMM|nr:galactose mutarotase [Rheinheimera riviphila]